MIVSRIGYLKLENVLEMIESGEMFSIYRTHKGTEVLVKGTFQNNIKLFYPKSDRLPYKITEGKKICKGIRIFYSKEDVFEGIPKLSLSKWNNKEQIMSYEEFTT